MNIGKRAASSSDSFHTPGANCNTESFAVVKNYMQTNFSDLDVDGTPVIFTFSELSNDVKMLALLAGELPNSAKCFLIFANASKAHCQKSMALLEQVMITPGSHGSTRQE